MGISLSNGQTEKPIQFRVDRPLGKLVKWLRLLGFDTISESLPTANKNTAPGHDDRIWITKAKLMVSVQGVIQIRANNPYDQLRQVITALRIQRQTLKPFTRCSTCNRELSTVARETVRGRVPDYIWETHRQFRACDCCHKIFWPGSHVDRHRQIIDQLFE